MLFYNQMTRATSVVPSTFLGDALRQVMRRFPGFWHHPDFLRFWAGQTVSMVGSRVTVLALPLTAILTLHASPLQIGLLGALGSAASFLFGLVAGVWVDRVRRRPIMTVANLGRAALLFSIPVAAWRGVLHLPQLYIVSFLAASLAVFFNVAQTAYLPSIVPREHLVEANSGLRMSSSAAQIVGPGVGGMLVQLLTPPVAIAADALSFIVSAISLLTIRTAERLPRRTGEANIRRELAEGIRVIVNNPFLRSLAGASATFNLFDSMLFAVYVLYLSRSLHLTAATIGLVFGLAGIGGLLGALLVPPLTSRLGVGRAILWGVVLATSGELLIAAAAGPAAVAVLVLLVAEGAVELGATLYAINVASLQQAITPDGLRGRVSAGNDLATFGLEPVGAVLGGLCGEALGLRATVIVAGVGTLLSVLWLVRSPVRGLRDVLAAP
jgi:MFS family permease